MLQIVKPNTKYPFIANRKLFLMVSGVLVVLSLLLPFILPINWGTSFSGGSSIQLRFDKPVALEDVRRAFESTPEFADVSVQGVGAEGSNVFLIKTRTTAAVSCDKLEQLRTALSTVLAERGITDAKLSRFPACDEEAGGYTGDLFVRFEDTRVADGVDRPEATFDVKSGVAAEDIEAVLAKVALDATVTFERSNRTFVIKPAGLQADVTRLLTAAFPDQFNAETGIEEIVTVGPDVGAKFRNDGILAIIFALGMVLLYLAIRFDVRFAPAAVLALIHDVVVVFGLYIVLGLEVTLETVAALLAIVGYSINDTIVTFDRIRENLRAGSEESLPELINRSVNECLSRTLLTSLTTGLSVLLLASIGTGVIRDFAITLTLGVIVGTYSSIFVASPLMLWFDGIVERRKAREATRRKLEEAAQA